jgi:hypothetical protein
LRDFLAAGGDGFKAFGDAQLPDALASGKIVRDELGNEVGEGGALMEGSRLYVT